MEALPRWNRPSSRCSTASLSVRFTLEIIIFNKFLSTGRTPRATPTVEKLEFDWTANAGDGLQSPSISLSGVPMFETSTSPRGISRRNSTVSGSNPHSDRLNASMSSVTLSDSNNVRHSMSISSAGASRMKSIEANSDQNVNEEEDDDPSALLIAPPGIHEGGESVLENTSDVDEDDDDKLVVSKESAISRPGALSCPYVPRNAPSDQSRFDWQKDLTVYLTGETLDQEKQRRAANSAPDQLKIKRLQNMNLWENMLAVLHEREQEEGSAAWLEQARSDALHSLSFVPSFHVDMNSEVSAQEQAQKVLSTVEHYECLFSSIKAAKSYGALYASKTFQDRLDTLQSWMNAVESLELQRTLLTKWSGSTDINQPPSISFVERILKEGGIRNTFYSTIMNSVNNVICKTKDLMIANTQTFRDIKLPSYSDSMMCLAGFPVRLMERCMFIRMKTADSFDASAAGKLVVEQLLDDLRLSLKIATDIKTEYNDLRTLVQDLESSQDSSPDKATCDIGQEYDGHLKRALNFYVQLLDWQFKNMQNSLWSKDATFLESEWEFMKAISSEFDGGDQIIALEIWYHIVADCELTFL